MDLFQTTSGHLSGLLRARPGVPRLVLNLGKANWLEWSRKLNIIVLQHGLKPWLEGTLSCPDPVVSADAHYAWSHNDDVLEVSCSNHISTADIEHVKIVHHCLRPFCRYCMKPRAGILRSAY